jgi:ribosomal protein S3
MIIGKGGQEVDKLKEELKKITDKDVQINIFEVKRPDLDAVIVANNVARQVEGKIAYRQLKKPACSILNLFVRCVQPIQTAFKKEAFFACRLL